MFAGSNSGQYIYKRVDGYRIDGGASGGDGGALGNVPLTPEEREDEEACIRRGTITQDPQGITNHVRIIEGRYGGLYLSGSYNKVIDTHSYIFDRNYCRYC